MLELQLRVTSLVRTGESGSGLGWVSPILRPARMNLGKARFPGHPGPCDEHQGQCLRIKCESRVVVQGVGPSRARAMSHADGIPSL